MNSVKTLKLAALFGFLSVLIGAFGAHGLEGVLIENQRLETYKTAVNYQFYHTLALLLVGVLMMSNPSKYLISVSQDVRIWHSFVLRFSLSFIIN